MAVGAPEAADRLAGAEGPRAETGPGIAFPQLVVVVVAASSRSANEAEQLKFAGALVAVRSPIAAGHTCVVPERSDSRLSGKDTGYPLVWRPIPLASETTRKKDTVMADAGIEHLMEQCIAEWSW